MIKNLVTTLLFLLFCTLSYAQSVYQDVVYLKNGSVIRGVIIEQIPNESVKIETADKNLFVFKFDEIERITKEESKLAETGKTPIRNSIRYRGILDFGYHLPVEGSENYTDKAEKVALNFINGIEINPHLFIGLGVGFRYLSTSRSETNNKIFIPVFADLTGYLLNGSVSPFLSFAAGYSFHATSNNENTGIGIDGGLLLFPSLGVRIKFSENAGVHFRFGYELQRFSRYELWGSAHSSLRDFRALTFKVGFFF